MAKTGAEAPGTSGSQFFVVTGADVGLPPDYAIVGTVTDGMDDRRPDRQARRPRHGAADAAGRDRVGHGRGAVSIAAVVLAAGEASRFGTPKQRLLLPEVLERLEQSPVDEIVVVAGAHTLETPARVVTCAGWKRGPEPPSRAASRSSATTSRRRSSSSPTAPTSRPRRWSG